MYLPVGFVKLACDWDCLQYYSRAAAFDRRCGVDATEISAEEVRDRCPIAETDDVLARFWVEDDPWRREREFTGSAEHCCLLTEADERVDPSWPVAEDSGRCVYSRPKGRGLARTELPRISALGR